MSIISKGLHPVPLVVWGYAALISLFVLYIFYYKLLTVAPPSNAFFEFNAVRIEMINKQDPGLINVIMLGDSKLKYAVFDDNEVSEKLSFKLGKPVAATRIVNNWAVFHDFSLLIEPILKSRPDLIVIQETLLSKSRTGPAHKLLSREYLFWRYFGSGVWNPGDLNQYELQYQSSCAVLDKNETVEERKTRAFKWFRYSYQGESQKELQQFLDTAKTQGIGVVFVSLPISKTGVQGLPSPLKFKKKTVLRYPDQLPDSFFCDIVHLNKEGRTLYQNWLVDNLSQKLLMKLKNDQIN